MTVSVFPQIFSNKYLKLKYVSTLLLGIHSSHPVYQLIISMLESNPEKRITSADVVNELLRLPPEKKTV